MSTHKNFDKICCVVLALTLLLTVLFVNAEYFGVQKASSVMGYEDRLFDTSRVHTIDIVMDDWEEFTANCQSEEYYSCTVVIDNDAYKNVAIRGKGNTSLTQVASYGNDRYSFKIEFDHYDSANTYYGLDKLCLNNIIQDNTYMKDYLSFRMMNDMGVASPLCSYVYITVNGEDWGLYLAVEGVEESFLQRNYGKDYGELYKPDSQSMGGGRGNGEKFNMDDFLNDSNSETAESGEDTAAPQSEDSTDTTQTVPHMPDGTAENPGGNAMPGNMPGGDGTGKIPGGQNGMPEGGVPGGQMSEGMTPPDGNQTGDSGEGTGGGFAGGGMTGDMTLPEDESGGDGTGESAVDDANQNAMNERQRPDGAGGGGMMNGSDDVLLKYIDDDADSYANIFDNAKTDITGADKTRLIEALKKLSAGEDLENTVDVDAVIRYFVVHNFVLNFDSYTGSMIHNYYLYEKDGQVQMIPWDYNLAFGGFQSMGGATSLVNYPIDSPVSGGNTEDRPMIAWIFENEEYTELYHQYFSEFLSEYFDSGYFEEMMDSVSAMIAPYVEKDPTKFCTYEEFETGVSTLKEFCLLRAESISGQLNGTIGATSDTQESSTLIDAGDLQISDMGSMNNTMGGGMMGAGGMEQFANIEGLSELYAELQEQGLLSEMPSSVDEILTWLKELISSGKLDEKWSDTLESLEEMMQEFGGNFGGRIPGAGQDGTGFPGQMPSEQTDDSQQNGTVPQMPGGDMPGNNGQMTQPGQTTNSISGWILLGVSVCILGIGLVFALVYKRRK